MQIFHCKTKLICGAGAVSALGELHSRRLLLVADPFFTRDGTAQKLGQLAGAQQLEIYDQVQPDPPLEQVAAGTARLLEFAPDTVVALGGGSAIDCAKAMVYFSGRKLRLVAIPTTSGSGSEVTDFSVVTHQGVKYPLVDRAMQPQLAILDSRLLEQLPKSLIADCGFDVLAHSLEACVATKGGRLSGLLAREAFRLTYGALADSYRGQQQVRQQIHEASAMAGMAFSQAGLGLCHAISHALGGFLHLPHGRLNAVLLPEVVACNAAVCQQAYARLAREAALGGSTDSLGVRNLKNGLCRLRRELGLPQTLAQAGADPRLVRQNKDKLAERVLEDPCCKTNPLPVDKALVLQLLETVTGHG